MNTSQKLAIECSESERKLSLWRAIRTLKLSMYKYEFDEWRRLDAKRRQVELNCDELAKYNRLSPIIEWVFDDEYPGVSNEP